MKQPKTPRGWRRISHNTIIKEGDKFWLMAMDEWHPTSSMGRKPACYVTTRIKMPYIRRITKPTKRKGK